MRYVSVRQLVYKWHELPYVIQREIAHDLRVIVYSENFEKDETFHNEFFKRLKQDGAVEKLKHRLFPDYQPEPDTHPCA